MNAEPHPGMGWRVLLALTLAIATWAHAQADPRKVIRQAYPSPERGFDCARESDEFTGALCDNIYDALANFRGSEWTTTLLGQDVKARYGDLKQASADRCPRLLGTFVKAPEVQYHHEVYNQFLWNLF